MNSIIIIEDHPVVRDSLAAHFAATGRWQVAEIASQLGINYRTVENILSCIYDKTGIRSRHHLEML